VNETGDVRWDLGMTAAPSVGFTLAYPSYRQVNRGHAERSDVAER
jgi:hypothetical protein